MPNIVSETHFVYLIVSYKFCENNFIFYSKSKICKVVPVSSTNFLYKNISCFDGCIAEPSIITGGISISAPLFYILKILNFCTSL